VLHVPAAEPDHETLPKSHDAQAEVSRDLSHLLIGEPALSQAREERVADDLEIRRDEAADVLPVGTGNACEIVVVGIRPHGQELAQHGNVVVPQPVLGARLREA